MGNRRLDPNFIIKIQDMMDIMYSLNRIRSNNYDDDLIDEIKKMNSIDKTESLLKILSKNGNKITRVNSNYLIRLMRDVDSVKRDVNYMKNANKKNSENKNYISKLNCDESEENGNFLSKIMFFLNSLNDEE